MDICLAAIMARRAGVSGPLGDALDAYMKRMRPYLPCSMRVFATEQKLMEMLHNESGRTRPVFLAADSRGDLVSSEELAAEVGRRMDGGVQLLVMGIGPADGWSDAALRRADRKISFGRVTLPHELAAVVAAEQIYRALTIRAGHPYHSGH